MTLKLTIEKGIPIPDRTEWHQFEVGDSAIVAKGISAHTTSRKWGERQNPPRRFITRTVTENGAKVTRIWRIT